MFINQFGQGGNRNYADLKLESNIGTASNTAVVETIAAVAKNRHILLKVYWSYDGTPTGGKLTITGAASGKTFEFDILVSGPGSVVLGPIVGAVNTAIVVTLAAGGSGVTGKTNCDYITVLE